MGPTEALEPVSESSKRCLPVNDAAMQKILPTEETYEFIGKALISVIAC